MISVKNLKKNYKDFSLDISMEIPDGRVSGLVGKNGAGKTTVIKSILGLVKPDSGSVTVMGREAEELRAEDREKIGVVLSDAGFCEYMNIKAVSSVLKSMYSDFDQQEFLGLTAKSGLPSDKEMKDFSTGMKAKLKVIAAMSHSCELIILDEPTAGLDVVARNEILDMIRAYMQEHESCSMLITSHIASDLESLCDDIYLIHDGRIVAHEDTDVILDCYGVLKISDALFDTLDKSKVLASRRESFGYSCLTDNRQFYREKYPDMVIENGGIDELILMLTAQ